METKPSSLLKSPWKFLRDVLQTGYSKFSVFPINLIIKPPILEDRISKLPDDVLQHILSFLPTKHAVATSILSTRWIRLWESVQVLDFDDFVYLFPERRGVSGHRELFFDFVDKVLSVNKSPIIFKFRLRTCDDHLSRINGWIQNVVLRNVVEIDLILSHCHPYQYEECLRIPGCSSLEIVKIHCALTLYMPTSGCCFPNLRVLDVHVRMQKTENDLARELIPSLPRLEELSLCGNLEYYDGEIYINVTGTALKVLDITLSVPEDRDAEVMIDAPNLQVLRLKEFFLSSYQVKNMPRLNEIMIDIGAYYNGYIDSIKVMSDTHVDRLSKLLQGIDNAKSASISAPTLLSHVIDLHTSLPVFRYLTKLESTVDSCIWVLLIHWLQSTPNLKHLLLDIRYPMEGVYLEKEVDWSLSETVPPCLSSSITEIEITKDGTEEEEELLMYLLDNAKVLDKFIVNSHAYIKDGVPQALFTSLKRKNEKEKGAGQRGRKLSNFYPLYS